MTKMARIFITVITTLAVIPVARANTCLLTGQGPRKASPSLVQCYRDNTSTCCNSLTDNYIKEQYSALFTDSCARNYPDLEIYFCFSCSQLQPQYYDANTGTISICKSFVQKIWGEGNDITLPSPIFDECGIQFSAVPGESILDTYKVPSLKFSTAERFLNAFKPPFFEDKTIRIADDNKNCFNYSKIKSVFFFLFFVFIVTPVNL